MRILICGRHPYVRVGLRTVIDAEPSMSVIGEADNDEELESLARNLGPDVVVLDVSPWGSDTSSSVGDLASVLVVVVDGADAAFNWATYTYANIGGIVHRDAPADQLVEAVREAYNGHGYISPALGGALLNVVRSRLPRSGVTVPSYSPLTPRELDVLDLLQRGMQNKQIAEELGISAKTVKFHVSNILAKCQMTNRNALIACARADVALTRHES